MFGHLHELAENCEGFSLYRCSLCHSLARSHGQTARFLTNDDMALCLAVIAGLSENEPARQKAFCPIGKKTEIFSPSDPLMRFLAHVTMVLVQEKVRDDRFDGDCRGSGWWYRRMERKARQATGELAQSGFDAGMISDAFDKQRRLEKTSGCTLNRLSAQTALVMEKILVFACRQAGCVGCSEIAAITGRRLGRIIYIKDGLVDYHDDLRKNRFNPVAAISDSCQTCGKGGRVKIDWAPRDHALAFLESQCKGLLHIIQESPLAQPMKLDLARGLEKMPATAGKMEIHPKASLADSLITQWFRWAPFFWFTSPRAAQAVNGSSGGNESCYQNATFLIVVIMIYLAICRGWCGGRRRGPDQVTVDRGMCGGTKTYRRDPCSGRYRDDSCC